MLPANMNPVPVVTEEGLALIELLKGELRRMKEEVYGPNCNAYREKPLTGKETQLRRQIEKSAKSQLEAEVGKLFSQFGLELAKESAETRVMIEEGLGRQVEKLMQVWFPPNALVRYSLRVEGRNKDEMSAYRPSEEGDHWGYNEKTTTIEVLPAKEWPSAWRGLLMWDRRVDSEDMTDYMPEGADFLLTTVHKFEVVVEKERGKHVKGNGNGLSLDEKYRRTDNAESIHWRVKSGPEKLWKMVLLLTGLQRKLNDSVEDIVDDAGIRLLCSDKKLGYKLSEVCSELNTGYSYPELKESIILQKLPVKDKSYNHRKAFLNSLPSKYVSFFNRIMKEEDRSSIKISDKSALPYYIEWLTRFGRNNASAFDRNGINMMAYGNKTFDAEFEEYGYDPFAYKARNDGWRIDHYSLFEWLVAQRLAPAIMASTSLEYSNHAIGARMIQSGLASKKEVASLLARS